MCFIRKQHFTYSLTPTTRTISSQNIPFQKRLNTDPLRSPPEQCYSIFHQIRILRRSQTRMPRIHRHTHKKVYANKILMSHFSCESIIPQHSGENWSRLWYTKMRHRQGKPGCFVAFRAVVFCPCPHCSFALWSGGILVRFSDLYLFTFFVLFRLSIFHFGRMEGCVDYRSEAPNFP